jgi:phosphoenolpyruvate carboxykinase (ATP)
MAPHPENVIMLTCDAFGVLPPISKLTREQAMYHFLSGYTAKVAGTEAGIVEPQATFSTCFGAPFMALPPIFYARLLGERITSHKSACWLVNTGWSGGGYGKGRRMDIGYTRQMVRAALSGELIKAEFEVEPYFGLSIPKSCPGVPAEMLAPVNTWSDRDAYGKQAEVLRELFRKNFRMFEDDVDEELKGIM